MLPPDPYYQYDQPSQPGEVDHTGDYSTPTPTNPLPEIPGQVFYPSQGGTPLPMPYDDRDPTEQVAPAYQPPTVPVPYTERRANSVPAGLPYPPAPVYPAYQPYPLPAPAPPQIVYVRQRRPGWCSMSCSILAILLLMTCGLVGFGIYRGVTSALQTAGETIPARITLLAFCAAETNQDYSAAYQQFSSRLQQQVSVNAFTQQSQQLDQQDGVVTACARSNNSPDATTASSVTIEVNVTRTFSAASTAANADKHTLTDGTIVVVQEGSDWYIDQIATSLNLL